MNPVVLAMLLGFLALVTLVAELFLPSHGVLAVIGTGMAVAAIAVTFTINEFLGLGMAVGAFLAAPLLLNAAVKLWPHTPVGRRMILKPIDSPIERPSVAVGQQGTAASELRPMGMAEFGGARLEVRSELGIIPAGTRVQVVSFDNNKPCVRPV